MATRAFATVSGVLLPRLQYRERNGVLQSTCSIWCLHTSLWVNQVHLHLLQKARVNPAALEGSILDALTGAKGRGKEGLTEEQLQQLNDAVERLEQLGGVSGGGLQQHQAAHPSFPTAGP